MASWGTGTRPRATPPSMLISVTIFWGSAATPSVRMQGTKTYLGQITTVKIRSKHQSIQPYSRLLQEIEKAQEPGYEATSTVNVSIHEVNTLGVYQPPKCRDMGVDIHREGRCLQ